jgi:Ca-activated chloride channel family protein
MLFLVGYAQTTAPKQERTTRILFIFDASGSMLESWSGRKDVIESGPDRMSIAKQVLIDIIDTLKRKPNVELALRVYGFQSPVVKNDCKDTKLCVPFGKDNAYFIKDFIKKLTPNGVTPIGYSLEQTINDFPKDTTARNVIIIITDGEESCGVDPCSVSASLQKNRIVLKPFIIGMNIDERLNAKFECIGNYVNPKEPEEFRQSLSAIIQTVLSPATIQVALLDKDKKPTETDVNMTFYDNSTGFSKYNIYHTLTYRGTPDTIDIDPVSAYNLVVHTIPPVEKKNIKIEKERNTWVEVPAAQGFLQLKLSGGTINNNINNKLKCIVRERENFGTLHVQQINSAEKYLCGAYDLEFMTLPRIKMNNIKIDQSKTTTIEIPVPGILNLMKQQSGFGSVFNYEDNEWKKIYDLAQNGGTETLALQPGTYKILYRYKSAKKTTETIERNITINSGSNISERL